MARRKFRLDLNDQGIQAVLKGEQVTNATRKIAQNMADDAKRNSSRKDAEYKVTTYTGKDRSRSRVRTNNLPAAQEEAENRTLSRSIGRAKG